MLTPQCEESNGIQEYYYLFSILFFFAVLFCFDKSDFSLFCYFNLLYSNVFLDVRIDLDKAFFFQPKGIYIFLISRRKHMLWVLTRSASTRRF